MQTLRPKGAPSPGPGPFKSARPMASERMMDDSRIISAIELYHPSRDEGAMSRRGSALYNAFGQERERLITRFGPAFSFDVEDLGGGRGLKTKIRLEIETGDRWMDEQAVGLVESAGFRLLFQPHALIRDEPSEEEETTGIYRKSSRYILIEDRNRRSGDPRYMDKTLEELNTLAEQLCGRIDPPSGRIMSVGVLERSRLEREEREKRRQSLEERSQMPSVIPKPK